MKFRRNALVLIALTFTVSACNDNGPGPTSAGVVPQVKAENIAGTWTDGGCSSEGADPNSGEPTVYGTTTFTFSGNQVYQVAEAYSDPNCQNLLLKMELTSTFTLGAQEANKGTDFDVTLNDAKMTYYDQTTMDGANKDTQSQCHFNDWQLGVARDLTGQQQCNNEYGIGSADLSEVKLENGRLYYSDGTDTSSDSNVRDTDMSGGKYFIRK